MHSAHTFIWLSKFYSFGVTSAEYRADGLAPFTVSTYKLSFVLSATAVPGVR
jgi:hypothetical protein